MKFLVAFALIVLVSFALAEEAEEAKESSRELTASTLSSEPNVIRTK